MNWILAFNLDFEDPKPMSKEDAEKTAQALASKVSRQFTKGKTAYKELNEALSGSYSEAVAALMNPSSQAAEAKKIVGSIIAEEISVYGSSVPQDQLDSIRKAVIGKVKADLSLPGYKLLEGTDKAATDKRIEQIIIIGIEAAGAHVAGEDEVNGYSSNAAIEKYSTFHGEYSAADSKYAQINKSLNKLGMNSLYELVGNGDDSSAKTWPVHTLQMRFSNLKGELETGAEIENLKHLAGDVFSGEASRKEYDEYLDLNAKENILKNLESRSTNGSINPKLFMDAAMQLNNLIGNSNEALMLLYGFADSKGLDTGTDFGMMESVFEMMNENVPSERTKEAPAQPRQSPQPAPQPPTQPTPTAHQEYTAPQNTHGGSQPQGYTYTDSRQSSDDWRHKRPQDYTPDDFFNAYQSAKSWRDNRQEAKQAKKQEARDAKQNAKGAPKSKSKVIAGLLAIFFGCFGVQKFYLGHPKEGLITIAITILGSLVMIGPFVTGVLGLIEGVKYLAASEEKFDQIYLIEGKKWF